MATKVKKRKIRFSKALAEEVVCQLHEDSILSPRRKDAKFFPAGK
jgi:hypothetical protein